MTREIKVGKKTIGENTKISLSVATALWVLSGVLFIISTITTVLYINVKKDVADYKAKTENIIDNKLDKIATKDDQFLQELSDVKTNVGILLDRSSRSGQAPISPNITPENNSPIR